MLHFVTFLNISPVVIHWYCDKLVLFCFFSEEDRKFVLQSTETELIQLFRTYDELCEQQQDLENKLDEAEDTSLP